MDFLELDKYTKRYIEGKLSDDKEKKLLDWIKKSEANKTLFLKSQSRISNKIANKKTLPFSIQNNSIKYRIESSHGGRKRNILMVASIAAAFIIGIFFTALINNGFRTEATQNISYHNMVVPNGAKSNIKLPDGSIVWINSGSTFSYPNAFGKSRNVSLQGEAFFEVMKGKKPFIISTEFGDVEAKGTSFNIQAYENDIFQTTLVSGSVLVTENLNNQEVLLKPGQQLNVLNGKLKLNKVDTEIYTSWKDGRLIFRKEYLPNVTKRLERWYNVSIKLDNDPRLKGIWFNGTIEMESLPEVLELLKVTSPIDFSYNQKSRTININYKE